jgi:hypothetical protein
MLPVRYWEADSLLFPCNLTCAAVCPQDRLAAVNETLQKYMKKLRERTTHHMG